MSSTETQPDSSYFLRKLHSFTGILPVGAFLAEHFWSNSSALVSPAKYDSTSQDLQTIPFRLLVEWGGIFLPMLFHGGYGIYIWLRGKSNVSAYPWVGNWLYTFQRYTGLIAFAYIGWHLYTERWLTHGRSTYANVAEDMRNPWYLAFFCRGRAGLFVSSRRGHLEFRLQVGAGRDGQGAASGGAVRCIGGSGVQRGGYSDYY